MPEGDAVWRAARRLHGALAGAELVGVDLRWPHLPEVELRGRTTLEVVPRGKHILHRVEGGVTIHSHLRMDGSWRTRPTASVTPRVAAAHDIRAIVATQRTAAIGRLLGMLDVVPTAEEHRLVGHVGPDLLGADWDAALAGDHLRAAPDRLLGDALLDQRNLAGLGTMWTAEACFAAGLGPWIPVGAIDDAALAELLGHAHRLLSEAIRHTAPPPLAVYRRHLCERCEGRIAAGRIGTPPQERSLYYCPRCQPGPSPTSTR
ncbi:DNA glycosylase [Calidifontibacter sp. DB0510]|uniref:DNA-(apurinic or apyrimidinic site) lyase n=1 Tax=Metallococcus carri TaxID=1656884 RepID=A0A967B7E1_9MICO|nr:DNA-formamidopyrimidine glycosylase family protein [Metallococcus carri]NHN56111.1 DNA glycosylase [Metallococcus carri]NOP37432.1 DNA glycosylase [Calidifontibacter sp. DB2511S]